MNLELRWDLWSILAIVVAIAVGAISVWIYRRHRLPTGARIPLIALRLAAVLLVTALALRPAAVWDRTRTERARILVIVDASGSMRLPEPRSPGEALRLAETLRMIPPESRTPYRREIEPRWNAIRDAAAEMLARFDRGRLPPREEIARLHRDLAGVAASLASLADRLDTLSPAPPGDAAEATPAWRDVAGVVADLAAALDTAIRQTPNPGEATDPDASGRPATRPALIAVASARLDLERVQREADETAAAAATGPVREAVDQVLQWDRFTLSLETLRRVLLPMLRSRGEVVLVDAARPEAPVTLAELRAAPRPLGESARLGHAVERAVAAQRRDPISACVVLTDGVEPVAPTLRDAAPTLARREIPLIVIGVGATRAAPDLILEQTDAPDVAFLDEQIGIQAVVSRTSAALDEARVRLLRGAAVLDEQPLVWAGGDTARVLLTTKPTRGGVNRYEVVLDAEPRERTALNNRWPLEIEVLAEPVEVLVIDAFPRWETRWLIRRLEADPRIRHRVIWTGPANLTPASAAATPPAEADARRDAATDRLDRGQLFQQHMVVLGDVDPASLSPREIDSLRAYVEEVGGDLVLLAGTRHMPASWFATPFASLLPVRPHSAATVTGGGDALPAGQAGFTPRATAYGAFSPLLRPLLQAVSAAGAADPPVELPALRWAHAGVEPLPGVDVLLETTAGDPVLVRARVGAGRVVYLGSDAWWSWRRDRDDLHDALWRRILLWASGRRSGETDRLIRIASDADRYSPGAVAIVRVRPAVDLAPTPTPGDVWVDLVHAPSQRRVSTTPMAPLARDPRVFEAAVGPLDEGEYLLRPRVTSWRNRVLRAQQRILVRQQASREYLQLEAAYDQLNDVADVLRPLHQLGEAVDFVPVRSRQTLQRSRVVLWRHPVVPLLLAALLAAEWQLRRRWSLL